MATAGEIGKQLVARTPEVAGGMLRQLLDFGIDGNDTFPGARAAAAKKLQARGEREAAIDALVGSHIGLASAQGFATSVGGLLTLPIGLPANLAGMAILSVRMVAGVAHLRGYDVTDRRVRAAIALAMLGEDEVRRLVADGKLPTTPLAVATAPVFDPELERTISERVAGWLSSRLGGKHLAVVVLRRIPLVGGGVGAAVDGLLTFGLAGYAKREFVARQQLPRFSQE
ncbi:MAG: EcsC family protein [Actinobacteria bacterium]|nr:EcsC family protein [Actinomycetota bacterium]